VRVAMRLWGEFPGREMKARREVELENLGVRSREADGNR
jgi:hypothetical protein